MADHRRIALQPLPRLPWRGYRCGADHGSFATPDDSDGDDRAQPAPTLHPGRSATASNCRAWVRAVLGLPFRSTTPARPEPRSRWPLPGCGTPSSAAKYQGVMLVNPGGPGGCGTGLAGLGSYVPNGVGGDYDWIGFDPRGDGRQPSRRSLRQHYSGLNRPTTTRRSNRSGARGCKRAKLYATAVAGRRSDPRPPDDPRLRAGHGEHPRGARRHQQINYFGFSYGTYLGQVYATLTRTGFAAWSSTATSTRRGLVPARTWPGSGLPEEHQIWFGGSAKYDTVYHLGQDRARRSRSGGTRSARSSPPTPIAASDRTSGPTPSSTPGTTSRPGPTTARLFAGDVNKHRRPAVKRAYLDDRPATTTTTATPVYSAVQCTDVAWPKSWATWPRQQAGQPRCAVRDLGQRVVQRPLPVLAGRGASRVKVDGGTVRKLLLDRRDARRGDAVQRQPRGAQRFPGGTPDRAAGRHLSTPTRSTATHMPRQSDRRVPDRRHPCAVAAPAIVADAHLRPLPQPTP